MKQLILSAIIMAFSLSVTAQSVTSLTKDSFKHKVWNYEKTQTFDFKGDKPVIIDFYADWCGPCKRIAPIMEELQQEYEGELDIYKVDTQVQQELAAIFQIKSIPALLFIPLDSQPQMALGARSKEDFKRIIKEVLSVEEPG
jgi:thioredoxin